MSIRVPARRARRAAPAETRARLVAATAREIERHGYHGTDSNRIALAAGYAPGTFYKHFVDKRAAFLAAYQAWVTDEWRQLEEIVADRPGGADGSGSAATRRARAAALVDFVLGHHRRFRGLRAALRALVATDPEVRRFHRAERRRQLERMGVGPDATQAQRARAALLLLEVERVADAVADGELRALGVDVARAREHLIERLSAAR
jgi:AcrR family transcriptional regulator